MKEFPEQALVLMGDLADSKKMSPQERWGQQESLTLLAGELSVAHRGDLLSDVAITAGDSFQTVVARPETIPAMVWDLTMRDAGGSMHLGVGVGPIYTAFDRDPRHMDGPAFHNAREAVEKRQPLRFQGFGDREDDVLNGLADLLSLATKRLTARQRELLRLLHEGMSQQAVAEQLGVSKQTVSRTARLAGWQQYETGEKALASALALFLSAGRAAS